MWSLYVATNLDLQVVSHMGTMDQPWNCPHGRPTMRHLKNMNFEDIPIELLLKIIYYCVPLSTTNYATHLRRDANPLSRAWAKEKEAQVLGNIHHKKDLRNSTLVTLSCVNKNLRRLCLPVLFRNIICYNEDHLRNFQKSFISSVQEYTK